MKEHFVLLSPIQINTFIKYNKNDLLEILHFKDSTISEFFFLIATRKRHELPVELQSTFPIVDSAVEQHYSLWTTGGCRARSEY